MFEPVLQMKIFLQTLKNNTFSDIYDDNIHFNSTNKNNCTCDSIKKTNKATLNCLLREFLQYLFYCSKDKIQTIVSDKSWKF